MANLWFRLYSEFANDPKVQSLPEAMQRRLIMLFCLKCEEKAFQERFVTFHWRITATELADTKTLFIEHGFIDDKWNLLNWNKRQFVSDSSTDRVKRYRERQETLRSRSSNVIESDTEADTETDSEAESTLAPSKLATHAPPIGTLPCTGEHKRWPLYQSKVDQWQEAYPGVDVVVVLREARQWLLDNPTNRKTYGGMTRFLGRWLATEQNKPKGASNGKVGSNHQGAAVGRVQRSGAAWDKAVDERLAGATGNNAEADVCGVSSPGARPGDNADIPSHIRGSGTEVRAAQPRVSPTGVPGQAEVLSPSK